MCCALATNVSRLWAFAMSALAPKADIKIIDRHVCYGPLRDIGNTCGLRCNAAG